jgi:opacity protein-like surface antigen
MKKQQLIFILLTCGALATAPALAQNGFYGGVSVRDGTSDSMGLTLSKLPLAWSRFSPPQTDDATAQRALVFGGYRWKNDIALEATFNSSDNYSIGRAPSSPLSAGGPGLSDPATRTWNADVYTSWEFVRSLSLYGRLGYAQSDVRPILPTSALPPFDVRKLRDGVNYGVGLRYDMTRSVGLRVEYSRFNRYGDATAVGVLPDSDQVTIGVQFRF